MLYMAVQEGKIDQSTRVCEMKYLSTKATIKRITIFQSFYLLPIALS